MAAAPGRVARSEARLSRATRLVVVTLVCFFGTAGAVARAEGFWAGTIDQTDVGHQVVPGDPVFGYAAPTIVTDTRFTSHVQLDTRTSNAAFSRGHGFSSYEQKVHYDYGSPGFPCPANTFRLERRRTESGNGVFDDFEIEVAAPVGDEPGGEFWILPSSVNPLVGYSTHATDDLADDACHESVSDDTRGIFLSFLARIPGKASDAVIDGTYTAGGVLDDGVSSSTTTIEVHLKRMATLTVTRAGSGTGTVLGQGIVCGLHCNNDYAAGTTVALTPTAAPGSVFDHWDGACTGNGSCNVTMNTDKAVTAVFNLIATHTLTVARAGGGEGLVAGAGINCGASCTHDYPDGTKVALAATAVGKSRFDHWAGACAGSSACTVTMDADKTVTAVFKPPYRLTVEHAGAGEGTISGTGIACGGLCTNVYAADTKIALTPAAASGSRFNHWQGPCNDSIVPCRVTMDADKTLTAVFDRTCPDPRASFTARWPKGTLDEDFNAAASDSPFPTKVVNYDWNFGDGLAGPGLAPRHGYRKPGEYGVSLRVTNDCGASATSSRVVVVDAPATYAPAVYLHPAERYRPDSVGGFLGSSRVLYAPPGSLANHCREYKARSYGPAVAGRLGAKAKNPYRHKRVVYVDPPFTSGRDPYCDQTSRLVKANDAPKLAAKNAGVQDANGKKKGGFLLDNRDNTFTARSGQRSGNAPVYAEYQPGRYVIYWFFYDYNLWQDQGTRVFRIMERHEGDWEHIVVRLAADDHRTAASYALHECPMPSSTAARYESDPATFGAAATHPVVYSALGGHASFATRGVHKFSCLHPGPLPNQQWLDYVRGGGRQWKTWLHVVDATRQPWYGFGGNWGKKERTPSGFTCLCNYGPVGPGSAKLARALPPGW